MCDAANAYIQKNQNIDDAINIAIKTYGQVGKRSSGFREDYDALASEVRAPGVAVENENSKTTTPSHRKLKSKKSFIPKVTPVDSTNSIKKKKTVSEKSSSGSSVSVKAEKDRTKNPTTAVLLGSMMKQLPNKVYYQILNSGGTNLRLVLCSTGLSGHTIKQRQSSIEIPDLISLLLSYFAEKIGTTTPTHLLRINQDCNLVAGAFFAYPVPKNKIDPLLSKLKKMGLKSKEDLYPDTAVPNKKIKVPKAQRKKSPGTDN